tara:strand:+ start:6075 stop:8705 length:2631 start_codon:yes stop_codon:yes gene_type:complete
MTSTYTLSLNKGSLKDTELLGGKGANLAELTKVGFKVPAGFTVTSNAYLDFLSANNLDEFIGNMASTIDFEDPEHLDTVTTTIREMITTATIPNLMATEIENAYMALGDNTLVAVRSSSAVPDLGVSSFPGQMDTFYHIAGRQAILQNLKLCWASFWTARAAASRWSQGINHASVQIAAVIQEMVPSEISGVAFTVNPVTLADECVVEAIPGLGEALVSGKVTPERFVLAGNPLALREKPAQPKIELPLIEHVAELAVTIHEHYGRPQDIEWAYASGQLFVLQSRNVVSRSAEVLDYSNVERWNKPAQALDDEIIWTRAWSDEVLTRAITPLFYSLQGDLITKTYDFIYACYGFSELLPMRLLRFYKNRAYFSTNYLLASLYYTPQGSRDDEVLKFFTTEQKDQARGLPFLLTKKLLSEFRLLLLHRKYSFTRCYKTYYNEWLPILLRRVKRLNELNLDSANLDSLQEYSQGMYELLTEHCRPIGLGVMIHTAMSITLLHKLAEDWYGDGEIVGSLLCGLPENLTVESNEATWELSRKVVESSLLSGLFENYGPAEINAKLPDSEEGLAFLHDCEEFRREYDFRGAEDREISFPRWGDDLELLTGILKTFVQAGDKVSPSTSEKNAVQRREEATAMVLDTLTQSSWGFAKVRVFEFLLKHTQNYSLFRENQRYDADRVFYGERKAYLAIADRLVQSGVLIDPADIWFLSKEEVHDLIQEKLDRVTVLRTITPRKAEYRRHKRTTPPMFIQADNELESTDREDETGGSVLTGVAASPGKTAGRARVLHSLRALSRIEPGDILVTNSTDPGWTPVFLLIKGLVLETGGILAHGTVLSREYGLPAVTSVHNATSRIKDGEIITIDGSNGTVHLQAPTDP